MSNTYVLDLNKTYEEPELNELVQKLKGKFPYPIHIERSMNQEWLPTLLGIWAVLIVSCVGSSGAALLTGGSALLFGISLLTGVMAAVFSMVHLMMAATFLTEPARINNLRAEPDVIKIDISPGSGFTHISKLHEIPDGFEKAIHLLSEEKFYRNSKRSKTLKALGIQPKMRLLADKKATEGSVSLAHKQVSGGELSVAKPPRVPQYDPGNMS